MSRKYSAYDDAKLCDIMHNGKGNESEAAFKELYNRYSGMVHAYCLRIMGNVEQAEDVFQETFIKFYQKAKPTKSNFNAAGFLITIARNLCLNSKRDEKPTSSIEGLEYLLKETQNYEKTELLELISMALELIDFDYKEAFILREYNGLQYNEIAEITDTSLSNAKSRVFRAKQKIKSILEPYMKDLTKNG